MITTPLKPATFALLEAVDLLRAGEVVAFPTETVYGLGADARREEAVAKIYQAKGRPAGNPLIVHVADGAMARRYVADFSALAQRLAERFWPGPLTLVLQRGPEICPMVSAGRSTVAIRCPKHPVAEALLQSFGGPIAAPSANRSGFTSPTTAQHVLAELNGYIPLILDGGACQIGLESTVLDLTTTPPTLLRPGGITLEMLRETIGEVRVFHGQVATQDTAASPGLHDRHYAPRTPAFRFAPDEWPQVQAWAESRGQRMALLTHDTAISLAAPHETLLMPADAATYAQRLYAAIRELDAQNANAILVRMPHETSGLWPAIADRLRRATQVRAWSVTTP